MYRVIASRYGGGVACYDARAQQRSYSRDRWAILHDCVTVRGGQSLFLSHA